MPWSYVKDTPLRFSPTFQAASSESLSLWNVGFPHDIFWVMTIFPLDFCPRKSHPFLWFLLHLYSRSAPFSAELSGKIQTHLQIPLFIKISIWMSHVPLHPKSLNLSLSLHLLLSLLNPHFRQWCLSVPFLNSPHSLTHSLSHVSVRSPSPLRSLYFRPPSFPTWPFLQISHVSSCGRIHAVPLPILFLHGICLGL